MASFQKDNMAGSFSIDDLVANLTPVNPVRIRDGMTMAAALTLFAGVGLYFVLGVGTGLASGNLEPIFIARSMALLLIGSVSAYAAMSMARPSVDANARKSEKLALRLAIGAAALFPLTALIVFFTNLPRSGVEAMAIIDPSIGRECLTYSGLSALAIGSAITIWLRRGAVVSPERAGWLTGLAAGGFGASAYSLFCPMDSVVYIGTWFTLAVVSAAVAGRLIVPNLLRW